MSSTKEFFSLGGGWMVRAWHQKNRLESDFPFFLSVVDNLEFPPHWHKEIEIVYIIKGEMEVGLNNETYVLGARDIFLIGGGHVHYFIPKSNHSQSVIIQFGLSFFESFSSIISDRRFVRPLLGVSKKLEPAEETSIHKAMEYQIRGMMEEHKEKAEGYQMALKARLYDLVVVLVRHIPMQPYSPREKSMHISRLKRLEQVFGYIEANYDTNITLDEVATVANYSSYHFARFFKDTTGMTFNQYLNDFRIRMAEGYLLNMDTPITEIAYKSGFNSIKTFNRVFKQAKGCSPTEYRKNRLD